MKNLQRRIQSAKYIRLIKRIESTFIKSVYDALQSQIKAFTSILRADGEIDAKNHLDEVLINTEVAQVIKDIYSIIGVYSANATLREINKSAREAKAGFGINEILLQAILQYFQLYLLNQAVLPITQTTKDRILEMLSIGTREGWGVDRIASELESDDLTLARARMIVRTESLKAMQYGRQLGQANSKWETESEWIAANDHRTRHSHRDVDGATVDEGRRFRVPVYKGNVLVGHEMMIGPGDPTASAGNVINCRCKLATSAKRDHHGRLILKNKTNSGISVILPQEQFTPHSIITV